MRPPWSMVLFTVIAGAGQGVFVLLAWGQLTGGSNSLARNPSLFSTLSFLSVILLLIGLISAFFHLGRPSRAWRSASQWRTSWLSREIIVMPVMMGIAALHGLQAVVPALQPYGAALALIGVFIALAMWLCTGMIYGCLKFLQEWATPLTPLSFAMFGLASGALVQLATERLLGTGASAINILAAGLLVIAAILKAVIFARNARLKPKSTLSSATGIPGRIRQISMGTMGGSFNTREFFHGASSALLKRMRVLVLVGAFLGPLVILALIGTSSAAVVAATLMHAIGMIAERWLFFAQANHPQNLYYQKVG
jgi:sulfite dehydrogenase (quinone) subunit SoeC